MTLHSSFALLFALPFALLAGAPAASAQATPPAALRPGDIVRVTVWRAPELSGDFVVGADSTIRHPLYQDVKVAGVPTTVVRERLRTLLERYQTDPRFVIEPVYRVVVGGEVRQPNLYSLTPETTIGEAIALAGGPTDLGRLSKVRITREGREISADLTRSDARWAQAPVQSGDQIVVGRRNGARDALTLVTTLASLAVSIAILARQ